MNIVDIIIIIFILLSGITGYKRGVFKELIICLGTILVFYIAYQLKNPIGEFFLLKLPMFDFPNIFKGVITLNILVYQTLAFMIVLAILLIIFNIIVSITGIFEKILKMTIVLGIPSKILGFIVGLIEGYVITFVVLFFLTQPSFSFDLFINSKYSTKILTSSPVLTDITSDAVDLMQEIYALKDEQNKNIINSKTLDMMLEKKFVNYETTKKLCETGKITFDGIESILEKHKVNND